MLIAAALLLFTLLCIALSDDRAWDNVTRSTRNALVFDGRHREYGAFELRREYDRRFILALFLGIGVLGAGVGLARLLAPDMVIGMPRIPDVVDVDLTGIIDPPPPAVTPPAPPTPPASGASGAPSIIVIDSTRLILDTATFTPPTPDPGPPGPGPGPIVDPHPPGVGPVDQASHGTRIPSWRQRSRTNLPAIRVAMPPCASSSNRTCASPKAIPSSPPSMSPSWWRRMVASSA